MKGKSLGLLTEKINRRRFLKSAGHLAVEASCAAAGVIGFPYIVSASALGKAGDVVASERIVMGCIGMGGQGRGNMSGFMGRRGVQAGR